MSDLLPFISFEGLDYSGKTTQIEILTEKLRKQGINVLLIREPGGTQISENIREILLDKKNMQMTEICEVLLYSAARHQLVTEKIQSELTKGNFVIADRYVDSTTAYQGFGRQIPMSFIKELNKIATNNIIPSLTFFIDIDLKTLKGRKLFRKDESDRLESQKDAFYERIRKGYLNIAELDKTRVKIINGEQDINTIKNEIWEFVSLKLSL